MIVLAFVVAIMLIGVLVRHVSLPALVLFLAERAIDYTVMGKLLDLETFAVGALIILVSMRASWRTRQAKRQYLSRHMEYISQLEGSAAD